MTENNSDDYVTRSFEVFIRLGLVLGLAVWCFQIIQPFISVIVWGLIIAVALQPLFDNLHNRFGRSRGLSATIFTLLALALLLTPTIELSSALVSSAQEITHDMRDGSLKVPPPPEKVKDWPLVGEQVYEGWALANQNVEKALVEYQDQFKAAASWVVSRAAGAGLGILQFALSIIISGVTLTYAAGGADFARKLGARLAGDAGVKYADLASSTVRSVAQGVLGVAFIQALLAGLGFTVMGIPGAGLWTVLVLILAIVQVSPGLVIVPTIFYVFSTAGTLTAVLYLVYGIAVTIMDNVLKPILLGRGVPVPMAVIFLGAIGGFIMSGFVGLFVGAVIMVLGYDLFMLWLNEGELPREQGEEEAGENA